MDEQAYLHNPENKIKPVVGIILTRHVIDVVTNRYWNMSVKCLQNCCPGIPIIIIDDNSDVNVLKAFENYKNVKILRSDLTGRGELLPFVYLLKYHFFDNALILHDSVFLNKAINLKILVAQKVKAMSLWHFDADHENMSERLRIASTLKNVNQIQDMLSLSSQTSMFRHQNEKWYGCFGAQCFINTAFLQEIETKYRITNMIHVIKSRKHRQCLERILGCIFSKEFPLKKYTKRLSILGNIVHYQSFGNYTFSNYIHDKANGQILLPVSKVWTGR